MRTCVIFNPAAKGDKARRFRVQLDAIATQATLKKTAVAGDARRLTAEAIAEGCDTVIAAGGDGTVNEVLNGIGDANAFDHVRLGVLPLGTVNVFALELGIPFKPARAWDLIVRGRYTRIDLGWVEFSEGGKPQRRYFMQLAGAGLDARAIELVDWQHKKRVGPLAYVIAGWKALREPQPKITVRSPAFRYSRDGDDAGQLNPERQATGELVLVGNGKYYGGRMKIFPAAKMRGGLLDICVFPRVSKFSVLGNALYAALFRRLPEGGVQRLRAPEFSVSAEPGAGFELDGEWVGRLPVKFGVEREKLRIIVP